MKIDDTLTQHVLVERGLLTADQIREASLLSASLGKSLIDTLIFKNYISEDELGKVLAAAAGVGYVSLKDLRISNEVLSAISEEVAITQKIVPFAHDERGIHIAMADPTNAALRIFLERQTGLAVIPYLAFPSQIQAGLSQYKRDINADIDKIMAEIKASSNQELSKIAEETPTIRLFNTLMNYGLAQGASDIHIEAQETNTLIRFRLDGILHDILLLDKAIQPALVARLKFLCNLKIDEHRLPQDGRFKYEEGEEKVAVRVSIIPSFFGENLVMRLLKVSSKIQSLEELGFTPTMIAQISSQVKRTNGIILLTGPTGSGKTTSLYSILETLNKPEVKIATIEDPIEYGLPRVSQIQTNPTTGLDFATGLRALLRHDPNIIMVGEIRDKETASISINAALTGHLVLSTLHTNDATSALPRLLDLNVEAFLLSATLRMVVAQRLVRKLCEKCRRLTQVTPEVLKELSDLTRYSVEDLARCQFYEPQGCSECNLGYRGRFVIAEVLVVDDTFAQMVNNNPNNETLRETAIKSGMITLIQDGIIKASQGITSLSEILREARE